MLNAIDELTSNILYGLEQKNVQEMLNGGNRYDSPKTWVFGTMAAAFIEIWKF